MIYIGIDPGWTGAIAWKDKRVRVKKCPMSYTEMDKILKNIGVGYDECVCVLENVHGRGGWDAQSIFRFGENFGAWKALLTAYKVKFIEYTPRQWQDLLLGKFPKGKSKQYSLNRAVNKFRSTRIKDHNVADALNLLDLCIRTNKL